MTCLSHLRFIALILCLGISLFAQQQPPTFASLPVFPAYVDDGNTSCTSTHLQAASSTNSGETAYVVNTAATVIAECRSNASNWIQVNTGSGGGNLIIDVGGSSQGSQPALNFISGTGIIQSCANNSGASRVDCTPALDTSYALGRALDQAGTDHSMIATSGGAGVSFAASGSPTLANYTQNQTFSFIPSDSTCAANATLNIDSLGPIALKKYVAGSLVNVVAGDCAQNVPILLRAYGSPVSAFVFTPDGAADPRAITLTAGSPGGAALTTSSVSQVLTVPFKCTVTGYNLDLGPGDSGGVTVSFWKVANGTSIPTSSNSISHSGLSLSSGTSTGFVAVTAAYPTSDFTTLTVNYRDKLVMAVTAVSGSPTTVTGMLECPPQ
jgi:hypothetical protein